MQHIKTMPDKFAYVAEHCPRLQHFHNGLTSIKPIMKKKGWMDLLCAGHYALVTSFYELRDKTSMALPTDFRSVSTNVPMTT